MQKIASNVVSYSERSIIDAKQLFGFRVDVFTHPHNSVGKVIKADKALLDCPIAMGCCGVLPDGQYLVDTKVSMLKTGYLPCIGGWHFDEVARYKTREGGDGRQNITGLLDGALDWEGTDPNLTHYLVVLDSHTGSLTEFFDRRFSAELLDTLDVRTYGDLHKFIETGRAGNPEAYKTIESNCLYKFNVFDAHRGQPALGGGWRYFFRATLNSKRPAPNEIRTQTQVYVPESQWEHGY